MDTPADPDCYWVEPGRLLAGEYPGSFDEETARQKLRALLDRGIRMFVDLTEDSELEPYDNLLEQEAQAVGTTASYLRMPIRDMSVPHAERMREILDAIAGALQGGTPVYLHCWGGVGRTGTVVGCWLTERGLDTGDAIEALAGLRAGCAKGRRPSPETAAQFDFVRRWVRPASPTEPG